MAIKTCCNWGLYNEDNGDCLEVGDYCDRFLYYDNGKGVVLENVNIQDIREKEVTLELDDYEEITIDIEDVIDWE